MGNSIDSVLNEDNTNMALTNFKTYVTNCIKPFAKAISQQYLKTQKLMVTRIAKQDEALRKAQEDVARYEERVLVIQNAMLEYKNTVEDVLNNQVKKSDYRELQKDVKRLEKLYSVVLDVAIDLKNKGESDKVLPNPEKPFVTRAELERIFKLGNGIDEGAELTPDQLAEFETFVTQYFADHPDQYPDIES